MSPPAGKITVPVRRNFQPLKCCLLLPTKLTYFSAVYSMSMIVERPTFCVFNPVAGLGLRHVEDCWQLGAQLKISNFIYRSDVVDLSKLASVGYGVKRIGCIASVNISPRVLTVPMNGQTSSPL